MLKSLVVRWQGRKKYPFSEMPDSEVAFFALSGSLVAGYYSYIFGKAALDYIEIANRVPLGEWGWQVWYLTAILAALGFLTWFFGSMVALPCTGILRERWFK
jgi:hypothetical protein